MPKVNLSVERGLERREGREGEGGGSGGGRGSCSLTICLQSWAGDWLRHLNDDAMKVCLYLLRYLSFLLSLLLSFVLVFLPTYTVQYRWCLYLLSLYIFWASRLGRPWFLSTFLRPDDLMITCESRSRIWAARHTAQQRPVLFPANSPIICSSE